MDGLDRRCDHGGGRDPRPSGDQQAAPQPGGFVLRGTGRAASRRDAAVRRERILDAAEDRFAADGFDATGTAAIADAARVPKGLVFYYFPRKVDILRALLDERLPSAPLCRPADVASPGDPVGSLIRLARRLRLGEHESVVLRTIIFRESGTHPEVREHLRALREGMLDLTEAVLDGAVEHVIDPVLRRQAAHTFVAVLLDDANTQRYDGAGPDLDGAARVVCGALSSR